MLGCVKDVVVNKNLLVQFLDRNRIEMSASSLSYVCSKEEIGQDGNNNISELPPK